jgi:copper chaperone NosL
MPASALLAAALLAASPPALAAEDAAAPGPKDKCPVCGMFVAKYPDWVAGLSLSDGTRLVFDGPKDLLKFWLDPARWLPARRREEIDSLFVTDYYGLQRVNARAALYVVGSDVLGPMGRELVPFARREEADEFARDHRGTRVLRFDEITAELVASLDR